MNVIITKTASSLQRVVKEVCTQLHVVVEKL